MMNDTPYTTPDEDPFNVKPLLQQPQRRRSSLLDKWIEEQQIQPTPFPNTTNTKFLHTTNPPDIGQASRSTSSSRDEVLTLNSFYLVGDDDIISQDMLNKQEMPSTPTAAHSWRTSRIPSPFHGFNISFRSSPTATSNPSEPGSPRSISRISFLSRPPRQGTGPSSGRNTPRQHNRSASLSTLHVPSENSNATISGLSSKWRPSILGYFHSSGSQPSVLPSETVYTPSRPSVSSADTYTTSTATTAEYEAPLTPPRISFMNSLRSRSRSSGSPKSRNASSSSVWSQTLVTENTPSPIREHPRKARRAVDSTSTFPSRASTHRMPFAPSSKSRLATQNISRDGDENEDDDDASQIAQKPVKRDPTRPHVAYSSGTQPRVSFATLSSRNQKKKRKLVVSGVGPNDVRKFEGVKRWCESFGEVNQITRMPNNDLHVHFRRADVADTVCRLRAKVYIAGVGSVQLSWYSGNKR